MSSGNGGTATSMLMTQILGSWVSQCCCRRKRCWMPGRNESEARKAYRDPIADALKCVAAGSRHQFRSHGSVTKGDATLETFALDRGQLVALGGPRNTRLQVVQNLVPLWVAESKHWRMTTREYIYLLVTKDVEVAWHWHPLTSPRGGDPSTRPHSHIQLPEGTASEKARKAITRLHIPSGRVTVEQVVRYIIEECEVKPLHDDWDQMLSAGHDLHVEHRTWHSDTPTGLGWPSFSSPRRQPHYLRHAHAAALLRGGDSVLVAQKCLGHLSPTETLATFWPLVVESDEATRAAIEAVLRDFLNSPVGWGRDG